MNLSKEEHRTYADIVIEGEPLEEPQEASSRSPRKGEESLKGPGVSLTKLQSAKQQDQQQQQRGDNDDTREKPARIKLSRTDTGGIHEQEGDQECGQERETTHGLFSLIRYIITGATHMFVDTAYSVSNRIKSSTNGLIGVSKETSECGFERAKEGVDYLAQKTSEGACSAAERIKRGTDYTAEKIKKGVEGTAAIIQSGAGKMQIQHELTQCEE